MIDFYSKPRYDFEDLCQLVRVLRAPDGCPWDSVQTHESIRRNFLEEVYEACKAIDQKDPVHLREELGDVLLHVVFHAGIEARRRKLYHRRRVRYGGKENDLPAPRTIRWGAGTRSRRGSTRKSSLSPAEELDSVARSLPALWRAEKLQKKAEKAQIPVEFPEVFAAVNELEKQPDKTQAVGKLLFAAVQAARQSGVDPEMALHGYCETFIRQVNYAGKE